MGWLSSIGSVFSGIGGLVGRIFGSKEQREKNTSQEVQLSKEALIAEFQSSASRKDFFTVFVDGLNRLVRPTFSYGVIAFFVWVVIDPVQFTIAMQALALVPSFMYGIFLTIIGFWFGGRIVEKYADAKLQFPTNAQLQEVLNNQKLILEQTQQKEKELDDHIITSATIATPNPVINQVVSDYNNHQSVVNTTHRYTMEPIYEADEQHLRPENSTYKRTINLP